MEKYIKSFDKQMSNKGITLVEVIVALMILTILTVAFTNLMGFNFINIFNMGEKSKAIAKAMEKTDQLNVLVWNAENTDEATAALENSDNGWVDLDDLPADNTKDCVYDFEYIPDKDLDGTNVEGYDVTVIAYYPEDFKYHVKLESFILLTPSEDI